MKPSCVRAVRKAAKITNAVCADCPAHAGDKYRCCDAAFCQIAKVGLEEIGRPRKPVSSPLLYMGPDGCVLPPELRPGCSGYVCPTAAPEAVIRERDRLMAKALKDPTIKRLRMIAADCSSASLLGKLNGLRRGDRLQQQERHERTRKR